MGHASPVKGLKGSKKEKAPSARKGRPTPHGDFTKKILEEHKEEVDAFKAELKETNPDQKGGHLLFISKYKKEHMDEYAAFETAWKEAHPKEDGSASDTGSVSDAASAAGGAPAEKPKRVISDEQKAKMKAGREKAAAEKKAAKAAEDTSAQEEDAPVVAAPAAVAPVAAPAAVAAPAPAKKQAKQVKKVEVTPVVVAAPAVVAAAPAEAAAEEENEFLPFKHAGANYMRLGISRADGKHLWATGDLWASKKGTKGDYIGCLQDDGSIDKTAEEPEME